MKHNDNRPGTTSETQRQKTTKNMSRTAGNGTTENTTKNQINKHDKELF
jgi:hypothetical protein